ncbi:MAG: endo alpha-1,4 polygalactosaminidase [Acidimicrobiales bacterium]|nr:endo alpha-1,4 polygalactosaminidase [Acidimicrobiales bacterium]
MRIRRLLAGAALAALVAATAAAACTAPDDGPLPPGAVVWGDPADACRLLPPDRGAYHAAFPFFGNTEDEVSADAVEAFEALAGTPLVWASLSDNWFDGIRFPADAVDTVRAEGVIPLVRLMPWNRSAYEDTWDGDGPADPGPYAYQAIIDGRWDADLRAWARAAAAVPGPLLVELGVEVNGDWFPWSGLANGGGRTDGFGDPARADGPERFRGAYRHVVELFRSEGATNVTWFFHVNADSWPAESWNTISEYYPGDDVVDWVGVSAYGRQAPGDEPEPFVDVLGPAYAELRSLTTKPLAVEELGDADLGDPATKARWITEAYAAVRSGDFPGVRAMAWWHERWENGEGQPPSDLRVDSSPAALAAYRAAVADPWFTPPVRLSLGCWPSPAAGGWGRWRPEPGLTWQLQLSGPVDTSVDADVYDVDLVETPQATIDALQAAGRRVVCYLSAGSHEDWRPDAGAWPAEVLGRPLVGWPGERWVDVRRLDVLAPLLAARLDLARAKGCDAVDPDNVDGYASDTGFPLTADDQLRFNRWLAGQAHARGLAVGLKNDVEQVAGLVDAFDFAVNEQCFAHDECEALVPFVRAGKAVFGVEYEGDPAAFCPQADRLGFSWILKRPELDAWVRPCPT